MKKNYWKILLALSLGVLGVWQTAIFAQVANISIQGYFYDSLGSIWQNANTFGTEGSNPYNLIPVNGGDIGVPFTAMSNPYGYGGQNQNLTFSAVDTGTGVWNSTLGAWSELFKITLTLPPSFTPDGLPPGMQASFSGSGTGGSLTLDAEDSNGNPMRIDWADGLPGGDVNTGTPCWVPLYNSDILIYNPETTVSWMTPDQLLLPANGGQAGGTTPGESTFYLDVIPEPSTLVLLGIGAMGLLGYIARRRAKA